MDMLASLWLAILAAGAAVFFCGFLFHAVLPFHKGDWAKLPDEQAFMDAMRALRVPAGNYVFPQMRKGEAAKEADYVDAMKHGPLGTITVWPGFPNMGKNLAITFAWNLLTTVFVAYLASITLPKGAEFMRVLQVAGTAGVLAHSFSQFPPQLWYQANVSTRIVCIVEGVVCGVVTGVIFAAMWPQ